MQINTSHPPLSPSRPQSLPPPVCLRKHDGLTLTCLYFLRKQESRLRPGDSVTCDSQHSDRPSKLLWITVLPLILITFACQEAPERRYDLKGTVVSIDAQKREVTVAHNDIPGYMNA